MVVQIHRMSKKIVSLRISQAQNYLLRKSTTVGV